MASLNTLVHLLGVKGRNEHQERRSGGERVGARGKERARVRTRVRVEQEQEQEYLFEGKDSVFVDACASSI